MRDSFPSPTLRPTSPLPGVPPVTSPFRRPRGWLLYRTTVLGSTQSVVGVVHGRGEERTGEEDPGPLDSPGLSPP